MWLNDERDSTVRKEGRKTGRKGGKDGRQEGRTLGRKKENKGIWR